MFEKDAELPPPEQGGEEQGVGHGKAGERPEQEDPRALPDDQPVDEPHGGPGGDQQGAVAPIPDVVLPGGVAKPKRYRT